MKVGIKDGKLRLATRSEARRVRQRLMAAVVSPTGGRSRRVTAEPDLDPDLVARSHAGAGSGQSLPQNCAGSAEAAECEAPQDGAEAAQIKKAVGLAPLRSADRSGTDGGFSTQLKAALQAAQHSVQEPVLSSASRPPWDLVSAHVTALPSLLGQPLADAMPVLCSATLLPRSAGDSQPTSVLPPAQPRVRTPHHTLAPRKTIAKAGRSREGGSSRAEAGKQEAPVLTNRGRVRQRGSKRVELVQVGKLRYNNAARLAPPCQGLAQRCMSLLSPT